MFPAFVGLLLALLVAWLAWRPVQLKDGRWAWLELVGRRLICDAAFMDGSRYFEYGVP